MFLKGSFNEMDDTERAIAYTAPGGESQTVIHSRIETVIGHPVLYLKWKFIRRH